MAHQTGASNPDHAARVGRMQLTAWLQTAPNVDAGIDETWIREQRGSAVIVEGVAHWRDTERVIDRRK
ncbi:hypothetical protein [Streptomyces hygroscopicus]|uniref:hypothetical protein n=1 Tax=Streptomyces hygroscopicus TaxID=1912 RepID=UPI001FCC63B3|nr:hypothetical protein [Streptomyces hygroscopicus]